MSTNTFITNASVPVEFSNPELSPGIDGAGRSRSSSKIILFDSTQDQTFDTQKLFDTKIVGQISEEAAPITSTPSLSGYTVGGNGCSIGVNPTGIDPNTRMVPMVLNNDYIAARCIIQTKENMYVTSGSSLEAPFSGVFAPQATPESLQARIVLRTSVSGSVNDAFFSVPQNLWNIDPLDGTGDSGKTIQFNLFQRLVIDGNVAGGHIRFGFYIEGVLIYVHQYFTTNVASVIARAPVSQTFSLPQRFEISNQSNRAAFRCGYFDENNGVFLEVSDEFVGGQAISYMKECSFALEGVPHSEFFYNDVSRGTSKSLLSGADYVPVLSVRPKLLFNTFPNKSRLYFVGMSVATSSNNPVEVTFLRGGTITGGIWIDQDANNLSGASKSYEFNVTPLSYSGGHTAEGVSIPAAGGSGTSGNPPVSTFKTFNGISRIDNTLILQKPMTIIARAPAGNATIESIFIRIAELYG